MWTLGDLELELVCECECEGDTKRKPPAQTLIDGTPLVEFTLRN